MCETVKKKKKNTLEGLVSSPPLFNVSDKTSGKTQLVWVKPVAVSHRVTSDPGPPAPPHTHTDTLALAHMWTLPLLSACCHNFATGRAGIISEDPS